MNPAWVAALTGVAVALTAAASWGGRWVWRLMSGTSEFLIEWNGRPAHAGLPAAPGVLARLGALERVGKYLADETKPNNGGNLHDTVGRMAEDVAAIKEEQARLRTQIELRHSPEAL
jgi:hypothetical protein